MEVTSAGTLAADEAGRAGHAGTVLSGDAWGCGILGLLVPVGGGVEGRKSNGTSSCIRLLATVPGAFRTDSGCHGLVVGVRSEGHAASTASPSARRARRWYGGQGTGE